MNESPKPPASRYPVEERLAALEELVCFLVSLRLEAVAKAKPWEARLRAERIQAEQKAIAAEAANKADKRKRLRPVK